ncbi:hypothetical protein [Vulgatibacter sp.]|uniref:hypothetical protein n=1 Tax=Vulgatibacter sp. TaxID=1971226 RepID=UPI00356950A9
MVLLIDDSPALSLPLPAGQEFERATGLWAGLAKLRARVEAGAAPAVVALGAGLERPLEAARQVRHVTADAHLVILCAHGGEALRRALRFEPQVGSEWSVVDPQDPEAVAAQLADLGEGILQRRKLRSTSTG